MIKHYFNFITSGHGRKEIYEPVGFDVAEFEISQEDGRKGRDVTSAGANNEKLRIANIPEYHFDIFIYNKERYGSEAVIKYEIEFDEDVFVVGDITDIVTDKSTYAEFTVIEENERSLLKTRFDVKTNLFSFFTLDDASILPVQTENVLLKAKPIVQFSKLKLVPFDYDEDNEDLAPTEPNEFAFFTNGVYFNPILAIDKAEVKNTLSALTNFDTEDGNSFKIVQAETNLKEIVITFNINILYKYRPNEYVGGLDKAGSLGLFVRYGATLETSTEIVVWYEGSSGESDMDFQLPPQLTALIPSIQTTHYIWAYFRVGSQNAAVNRIQFSIDDTISIQAKSVAYNTVVPMVRLIDAMRYNVKSASGLNISAPRWDFGGELYDQYITTQPLMRNLTDKPFNLSFKDIVEDYLPEVNGDYQLQEDGTVFFGAADENIDDFYKDYEIASFTQEELTNEFGQPEGTLEGYEEQDNERFRINRFKFSYDKFASQKENEMANTYDDVHGASEWLLPNKFAKNERDVKVGFIRSAFSIEEARRKAYDLSDKTATQDDDNIYISDIVPLEIDDRQFTETAPLQHRVPNENTLVLKNQQTFSWVLLGITPGSPFTISNGANAGGYIVISITDVELILLATNSPDNIDNLNTTFTYTVMPEAAMLTIRTDEGFGEIENIEDGNNYTNLRFTVKRNIIKRYGSYLATNCLLKPGQDIKNTLYKNNPEAFTKLLTEEIGITEDERFLPVNPILTPNLVKVKLLLTQARLFQLRAAQRLHNGYIKTFSSDGLPLKGYIKSAKWVAKNSGEYKSSEYVGEMETLLEEKYEQFLLYIFGTGGGNITLNDTVPVANFEPKIDKFEKLSIFDGNGKLMYPPVPYDRVKINNAGSASSPFELILWLNSLIA